jgi:hypothetical protein
MISDLVRPIIQYLDASLCALMLWIQECKHVERQWRCRIYQDHGY